MNINISDSSGEPIYEQIIKQIKKQIFNGELKEGEFLPSIRALAKELKLSVITTKRAYEELENQGFIRTMPSKGSYVAKQDKQLFEQEYINAIKKKLLEVIDESNQINLPLEDLVKLLEALYRDFK